jgi:hypothetical protein
MSVGELTGTCFAAREQILEATLTICGKSTLALNGSEALRAHLDVPGA